MDPTSQSRICFVTPEIIGLSPAGGIGTTVTSLAEFLASHGLSVTILVVRDEFDELEWSRAADAFARVGIRLVALPASSIRLGGSAALALAYRVHEWLDSQSFDFVHFPDWLGLGYFATLAKKQGRSHKKSEFCIGVHSPSEWIREAAGQLLSRVDDLEIESIERASIEQADAVWFPSESMKRWVVRRGWRIPAASFVRPHVRGTNLRARMEKKNECSAATHSTKNPAPIHELVFFGRLEMRKGLGLFCDALDRLDPTELPPGFQVTFLGRPVRVGDVDSTRYLRGRQSGWAFGCSVFGDRDQAEALDYLSAPGRLAVIPSLNENLVLTVMECLCLGIPFLASRVGGVPEWLEPADAQAVLFEPNSEALAAAIRRAFECGVEPSRMRVDLVAAEAAWLDWHRSQPASPTPSETRPTDLPRVSAVLVHHERPRLLRQSLGALLAQDYPNLEIVVVDDGSATADARQALWQVAEELAPRGGRVLCQENRYLGAARNSGAAAAEGEYLFFQDDDNVAKPGEIAELVRVAERTNAAIVTSSMDIFEGDEPPGSSTRPLGRWLFGHPDGSLGLVRNCFGDANALVARACFDSIGGFTEDFGITHEEWEFFAKAMLEGHQMTVIPEALFWYRYAPASMVRVTPRQANLRRGIRPLLSAAPPEWAKALELAAGLAARIDDLQARHRTLEERARWLRYRLADWMSARLNQVPLAKPTLKGAIRRAAPAARRLADHGRRITRAARRWWAFFA